MLHDLTRPFALHELQQDLPTFSDFHAAAKDLVLHMPKAQAGQVIDACMLFIDGAYDPNTWKGAWAVAVLSRTNGT